MTAYWKRKRSKEGGAVYDFISGLQVGIANMADLLQRSRNLYTKRRRSQRTALDAILDDFQSEENKKIQKCSLMTFQNTEMMMTMSIS